MKLQFFNHPEGYVEPVADTGQSVKGSLGGITTYSGYSYVFQYTDHLGNVRLSYSDSNLDGSINASSEIIEESNYYPFGLKQKGYNNTVSGNGNALAQQWSFLGQEKIDDLDINWLTFRYRNYMPDIGRFFGVDPVSSEYMSISTYQFAHNSPIWKIEMEGLEGATTTGDGNDDTTTHEPVKMVSQARNPPTFVPFVEGKIVQETVKKTIGQKVLQGLGAAAKSGGLVIMALLNTTEMAPSTSSYVGEDGGTYSSSSGKLLYPAMSALQDPKIDEKLRLDDKKINTEGESDSPIQRISGTESFYLEDSDDDTGVISTNRGDETILIGGDFEFDGDSLTINNFSVEGSSKNKIGISGLRAIMKKLGTELDVKTIYTNGTPRTTGANPGKITNLTFTIDNL